MSARRRIVGGMGTPLLEWTPEIERVLVARSLTIECITCDVTHTEDVPLDVSESQSEWWNEHVKDGHGHTYRVKAGERWAIA
jgi:hypothetical protein